MTNKFMFARHIRLNPSSEKAFQCAKRSGIFFLLLQALQWINPFTVGATALARGNAGENLGAILPLWSILPFAGMLLSIALIPLFSRDSGTGTSPEYPFSGYLFSRCLLSTFSGRLPYTKSFISSSLITFRSFCFYGHCMLYREAFIFTAP